MKEIGVMKTFIVYSLDTRLPVAVGEAIKAEWARFETAEKTKIPAGNLIAEEIGFIKTVGTFRRSGNYLRKNARLLPVRRNSRHGLDRQT
jgi:hypothetical protein